MVEPHRERKVVTVLFADLVGFTSRAEEMDPEDVDAELDRYHTHVRGELERFGGTVEKFIGDAVMALFGAPVAHEDDPERAVRAALAVRDWAAGENLEVRIGVNTGTALVKLEARPEAGEAMAAGDVVNTAARLQAAAPANGILVGETTYRATLNAVDYRDREPVEAKGKAEPVPAWEAVEARSIVGVDRLHSTRLVGRAGELALLGGALDRARRERSVQLVTLVGVPGIGKSRLVYELFRIVDADSELITWRQGRCLPYGDGVTFWALGEIVKAESGILETDTVEEVERKLSAAAREPRLESHLRPLVGLGAADLGSGDRRAEAFAAWREFFEELAEERPLVLVFEDLHWADDNLLDFVDHLVDWASGVPILVVSTTRPELLERRPAWGGGKQNALIISLSRLSDAETEQLVGELVSSQLLAADTQSSLLARAGGNPLYAEQYARILLERGELAELPETVQGIVAARLDLLAPEQKRLLQDAAVLGRTFWVRGLSAVSGLDPRTVGDRLHGLERRDFLRRERRSEMADDTQYAFLHVLVRDVAYAQLPRADRATRHRRAAGWIDSLGRPEDHAEMLAHHYVQAFELSEAAGLDTADLADPVRFALRDAGDRAAALYASEAAVRFYDRALELWPDDQERVELLYRRAVPAGRHLGGGEPAHLAEARDALLAAGRADRAAELEMLLSTRAWMHGLREAADEHAARAAALLPQGGPPSESRAWVLVRLASIAYLRGDERRAPELVAEARRVSEQAGSDEGLSDALSLGGMIRLSVGDRGGLQDIERSVEVAVRTGELALLTRVQNTLAVAYQLLGDLDTGYRMRLEGADAAERLGSETLRRWYQGVLVGHRYKHGEWDEALRDADDFLGASGEDAAHAVVWQVHVERAEIRLARDDRAGALADVDRALETARANTEVQAVSYTLAACAHVLALAAEPERAAALANELLAFLRSGARIQFAVVNLPAFACAAVRLGLRDELLAALAGYPRSAWTDAVFAYLDRAYVRAADLLAKAGTRPDEAEARLRAAEQLFAEKRRAEADEQLGRALDFYRSVGASRFIGEAEALLAATA
ncbi:MAG TPA: adenylate/guanylate cyclase domain-containing protein [Gaiellaceae bacterium]|nr:adenylate/guanylate cyclase domain-containing protein [Gaiellaceae bacterium]